MRISDKPLPAAPFYRRLPFFYGWVVLAVATMAVILSIPGQTMGVSVFTGDLSRAMGLSPLNLSLTYLIGTVASALILTPAGKLLDKWGARKMGTGVMILLGLHLMALSVMERAVPNLNRILPGTAAGGFVLMVLGFFLLRFLGQGLLTLVGRTLFARWFDHYRRRANAIHGTFTSFGFSYAPRFLNQLRDVHGWTGAWRLLGLLTASLFAGIFWLFARDCPEECGLTPDGGKLAARGIRKPLPSGPETDFTLAEARRTFAFWIAALTLGMQSLFTTAMTFHLVDIFSEADFSRSQAVAIFLPASFISVGVNFAASWLSDFVKMRTLLQGQLLGLTLTMAALACLGPGDSRLLLIIAYGITGGFFTVTTTLIWPRYFGTAHLGAIMGLVMGFMVAGSALGPYFFSLIKSFSGAYRDASLTCLAVTVILFILSLKVRKPKEPIR